MNEICLKTDLLYLMEIKLSMVLTPDVNCTYKSYIVSVQPSFLCKKKEA